MVLEVQSKACNLLTVGTKLSEVWKKCKDFWNTKKEELKLQEFPTTIGYGVGLELKDTALAITQKNDRKIEIN